MGGKKTNYGVEIIGIKGVWFESCKDAGAYIGAAKSSITSALTKGMPIMGHHLRRLNKGDIYHYKQELGINPWKPGKEGQE